MNNLKIIKRSWLPTTLDTLAPWFANFALKFTQFGGGLGFAGAVMTQVGEDNEMVQWLADADEVSEANRAGFRKYRDETLYDEKNSTAPIAPMTDLPAPPAKTPFAIIQRLVNLVERVELADSYTQNIGAQLGILPTTSDSIAPENWTTSLKVKDLPAYQLEVDFVKGESDGIALQTQIGDSETWTSAGNFGKRPVVLTVTPTTPNAPVSVRIRGRLLKGNSPVGEYSDIVQTVARA